MNHGDLLIVRRKNTDVTSKEFNHWESLVNGKWVQISKEIIGNISDAGIPIMWNPVSMATRLANGRV